MNQGKRFSLVYLNRNEPVRDSQRFRNRLSAFYTQELAKEHKDSIKTAFQKEAGIEIPYLANFGFNISAVFENNELRDVLDSITLVYQVLVSKKWPGLANGWKAFVERCMREENVGYQLDEECGVHYFVDEEFERNRFSTLSALDSPDLRSVKAAYDDAYRHLDNTPIDTKACVRSLFESLEILAKQMTGSKNLNKWLVQNTLKDSAIDQLASDDTGRKVISEMFDSFGIWVDAIHDYRHGQPESEPVAPSEELTVYVLSSGSSFLRFLLEVRNKI